jgi:hypothetical protein
VVDFDKDQLIFRVDFNNVADGGRLVKASLPHASSYRIPGDGERVFLEDGEGNRCWGSVERVEGLVVLIEIDDTTWVSGDQNWTGIAGEASRVSHEALTTVVA